MRSKRKIEAENRTLQGRMDECMALLAAVALQYGDDGKLQIGGSYLERVSKEAERSVALRLLTNGDMRVDFAGPETPELTMTVLEEAPCS